MCAGRGGMRAQRAPTAYRSGCQTPPMAPTFLLGRPVRKAQHVHRVQRRAARAARAARVRTSRASARPRSSVRSPTAPATWPSSRARSAGSGGPRSPSTSTWVDSDAATPSSPSSSRSWAEPAAPGSFLPTTTQFVPVVRAAGTTAQAHRFLAGVASGDVTGTVALHESGRFEPEAVTSTAEREPGRLAAPRPQAARPRRADGRRGRGGRPPRRRHARVVRRPGGRAHVQAHRQHRRHAAPWPTSSSTGCGCPTPACSANPTRTPGAP